MAGQSRAITGWCLAWLAMTQKGSSIPPVSVYLEFYFVVKISRFGRAFPEGIIEFEQRSIAHTPLYVTLITWTVPSDPVPLPRIVLFKTEQDLVFASTAGCGVNEFTPFPSPAARSAFPPACVKRLVQLYPGIIA